VSTNDALLVQDRFATAIPVEDSEEAARAARVDLITSPSRFNFDLRTPTGVDHMRAFLEADFAGDNGSLRLRHTYGQWKRAIFGQTWSTFSDPQAEPDGIDFEGLNAIVLFRTPLMRWSAAPTERIRIAFAIEDPRPELTGATGISQTPDIITRLRWEPRRGGHIQFAALLRQLRGEPEDQPNQIVSARGYGVNVSGRLPSHSVDISPTFQPKADRTQYMILPRIRYKHLTHIRATLVTSTGGRAAFAPPSALASSLWITSRSRRRTRFT
jgi:DcaP outer membrane protein